MSSELAAKIRVGLEELAIVRQQFEPLLSIPAGAGLGVIETAAACAMLHSYYTEIEKILKIIASRMGQFTPGLRVVAQRTACSDVETSYRTSSSALGGLTGNFEGVSRISSSFPGRFYSADAMGQIEPVGFSGRSNVPAGERRVEGLQRIH